MYAGLLLMHAGYYLLSTGTGVGVHVLISLRLRTNYVIRVMRIKDKGGRKKFKYYK
jgi:hypothetical protein